MFQSIDGQGQRCFEDEVPSADFYIRPLDGDRIENGRLGLKDDEAGGRGIHVKLLGIPTIK